MSHLKTITITFFVTLLLVSSVFAFILYSKDDIPEKETAQNAVEDSQVIPAAQRISRNDSISNSRGNIITETVKQASPAVVGINVIEIREYRSPLYNFFQNDPMWQDLLSHRQKVQGLGSGAIISPDGYIITNDHVAGNAVEVIVTLTDGTQYEAEVIGSDQVSDICLLKIKGENLPYIKLGNSNDVLIGEWAIALGNPFGLFDINDKPTVTVGVISATGMNLGQVNNRYYVNMIQTDAAINGGNSGGPLIDSYGELIGMNTLIFTAQGSRGNVGVGFAIPVDKIKKIVSELKAHGKVDRDFWTGLRIQAVDQGIANYYNLKNTRGVIVTNIAVDSPAEEAGLQVGDIILQVDKYKINDDDTLIGVLQEFKTSDAVTIQILRDNQSYTKQMKLERKNDQ